MSGEIIPTKETAIPAWLTNFATVATANSTLLALPPNTVTDLNTLKTTLVTQQDTVKSTREAAKAATVAKNVTVKAIRAKITITNRNVQGNANATPAVKEALGLNPKYAPAMPVKPKRPEMLTASVTETGEGLLKWKSGGNQSGTTYEIFAKRGTETDFLMIGSSGKTTFTDHAVKPGIETFYQVRARRSDSYSPFSTYGVLYPKSGSVSNPLVMDKAA